MNGGQRGGLTKNIRSLFVNWMHHTPCAAAVQLISKRGILCFKSALQIDWISTRLARTYR